MLQKHVYSNKLKQCNLQLNCTLLYIHDNMQYHLVGIRHSERVEGRMVISETLSYCFINCEGQSHKTVVHKPQPFRREKRAEAEWSQGLSAYQPNVLPLGQTRSRPGSVSK